jgi:hypothetical protein
MSHQLSNPGNPQLLPSDIVLEPPDRVGVHTQVIFPPRLVHSVDRDHVHRTNLVQREPLHTRVALDTENAVLAVSFPIRHIRLAAIRALVPEERVQAASIDHDVLAVQDAQAVCATDFSCGAHLVEVGVVVPVRAAVGLAASVGAGLVVWGFGLDVACEDVLGAVELVLVQCVVLDAAGP